MLINCATRDDFGSSIKCHTYLLTVPHLTCEYSSSLNDNCTDTDLVDIDAVLLERRNMFGVWNTFVHMQIALSPLPQNRVQELPLYPISSNHHCESTASRAPSFLFL